MLRVAASFGVFAAMYGITRYFKNEGGQPPKTKVLDSHETKINNAIAANAIPRTFYPSNSGDPRKEEVENLMSKVAEFKTLEDHTHNEILAYINTLEDKPDIAELYENKVCSDSHLQRLINLRKAYKNQHQRILEKVLSLMNEIENNTLVEENPKEVDDYTSHVMLELVKSE